MAADCNNSCKPKPIGWRNIAAPNINGKCMHRFECFPKNRNSLNWARCNNNNNWVSPCCEPNAEHRILHTPAEWLLFSVAYHSTYSRWILISNERVSEWAYQTVMRWVGREREREQKGEKTWFKIFQICWNFYGTFWMLYVRKFAGIDWLTGCQTKIAREKNMTIRFFGFFLFHPWNAQFRWLGCLGEIWWNIQLHSHNRHNRFDDKLARGDEKKNVICECPTRKWDTPLE